MSKVTEISNLLEQLREYDTHIEDINSVVSDIVNDDFKCDLQLAMKNTSKEEPEISPLTLDFSVEEELGPQEVIQAIRDQIGRKRDQVQAEREEMLANLFMFPDLSNDTIAKLLTIVVDDRKKKKVVVEKQLKGLGLTV